MAKRAASRAKATGRRAGRAVALIERETLPGRLPANSRAAGGPVSLKKATASARAYAKAEKAEATRRAYRSDFALFRAWCEAANLAPLPALPETVAAYVASEADAGRKASTIGRRVGAIRYAHKLAGLPTPTDAEPVRATVRGIRRKIGTAPTKKAPATNERIIRMVPAGKTIMEKRDRALLLVGFAGGFRRSELVALNVGDLEFERDGLRATVRGSKTDQERRGRVVGIVRGESVCPIAAVKDWLAAAKIERGPVFRSIRKGGQVSTARLSDKSAAAVVKRYAERVGLNPKDVAGHSLRSGFITSAIKNRANILKVMDVTGQRRVDTMRGYIQDAELFRDHAGIGLL